MCIGKINFTAAQRATLSFQDIQMTKADIFFLEFDQFITLKLKTSTKDVNYIGILLVIKTTHQHHFRLTVFRKLFVKDPQLAYVPLFSQAKRKFGCKYLIDKLTSHFTVFKIDARNYSGYNFRCSEL